MQHNQQEFLEIIETNKRLIFKICNSYCQNADDREDLAQEIIFQLWKSWGSFTNEYKLSTWMYRIALNVAISFYRKEQKTTNTILMGEEHLIEISDDNLEEGLEANLTALQKFINELKPLDKALMLLYLEEKSHKEMAEIIGITSTNVATKIGRIKEQLKQKFSAQH
ncbi:RNA polymerase sigma factor [Pedobacter boryungensis]|uniref:Sigma-70 family RNA polymerase sigma factor n=1 Tax=Pedobacter boryungensis TaxID=869962 RepID=A0ABX2DGJ7_9SPHI|nr:sigma-70 family RNA polymerase sigma factor [Pedobacter boryungensis]NQX33100.1 sigma-70 family RNA polymerase sigma factor [Pedobacter boryungensis]